MIARECTQNIDSRVTALFNDVSPFFQTFVNHRICSECFLKPRLSSESSLVFLFFVCANILSSSRGFASTKRKQVFLESILWRNILHCVELRSFWMYPRRKKADLSSWYHVGNRLICLNNEKLAFVNGLPLEFSMSIFDKHTVLGIKEHACTFYTPGTIIHKWTISKVLRKETLKWKALKIMFSQKSTPI